MTRIRAKFRCLDIKLSYDGTKTLRFGPVKRTTKEGKALDEENNTFWRYTPNGEAVITLAPGQACPFNEGDYFYVDMMPSPDGKWRISDVGHGDYGQKVTLSTAWGHKRFSFDGMGPDRCMGVIVDVVGGMSLRMDLSEPAAAAKDVRFIFAEPNDHVAGA